jgi:hypothetical protein
VTLWIGNPCETRDKCSNNAAGVRYSYENATFGVIRVATIR